MLPFGWIDLEYVQCVKYGWTLRICEMTDTAEYYVWCDFYLSNSSTQLFITIRLQIVWILLHDIILCNLFHIKLFYAKRWKKRMTQIHYFPLEIAFIKSCDLRLICPFVNMRMWYDIEMCELCSSLNLNCNLYFGLIFYLIVFTFNSLTYNCQLLFRYFDSFSLWFSMPVCFQCVFYAKWGYVFYNVCNGNQCISACVFISILSYLAFTF